MNIQYDLGNFVEDNGIYHNYQGRYSVYSILLCTQVEYRVRTIFNRIGNVRNLRHWSRMAVWFLLHPPPPPLTGDKTREGLGCTVDRAAPANDAISLAVPIHANGVCTTNESSSPDLYCTPDSVRGQFQRADPFAPHCTQPRFILRILNPFS